MVNSMSVIAKEEVRNTMRGFSEDEKRIALEVLPTCFILDEINRRTRTADTLYEKLANLINSVTDDTSLVELQDILSECKKTLKMD